MLIFFIKGGKDFYKTSKDFYKSHLSMSMIINKPFHFIKAVKTFIKKMSGFIKATAPAR